MTASILDRYLSWMSPNCPKLPAATSKARVERQVIERKGKQYLEEMGYSLAWTPYYLWWSAPDFPPASRLYGTGSTRRAFCSRR